MSKIKFELDDKQEARLNAWFKHHWDTVHKNWRPHAGNDGFAGFYMFGPTGCGCNVKYRCEWCPDNSPSGEVDLTIDEDGDGDLIIQYDENWNRLPWENS